MRFKHGWVVFVSFSWLEGGIERRAATGKICTLDGHFEA